MKMKQDGFGLVETLLSLLILSAVTLSLSKVYIGYLEKRNAVEYKSHVEKVIEALQKYQYHKVTVEHNSPYSASVWPASLDALMSDYPNQFWPLCSKADSKNGICQRPDSVPWSSLPLGYKINFVGTPPTPKVTLTFPLSTSVIDAEGRAIWANALQRLPFIKLESNKDLSTQVGDPLMVQVYKEFIQRNGEVELSDTWDVGGKHAIVNASAMSVRNTDGTQRRLGAGVIKSVIRNNGRINKHSCPIGLKADLALSVSALTSDSAYWDFSETGSFKLNKIDRGSYWDVSLVFYAKAKRTKKWREYKSGKIKVDFLCIE